MAKKAYTKDEQFILALYDLVVESGDKDAPILILEIQKVTKFHDKSLGIIHRNLAQANFVKKVEDTHLRLTPQGWALARKLLEE